MFHTIPKRAIGRIVSIFFTIGGWLLSGARCTLDAIGYSTVPEDTEVARTLIEQFIIWLLGIPWWVPWLFALITTALLISLSWPRREVVGNNSRHITVPDASSSSRVALESSVNKEAPDKRIEGDLEPRFLPPKQDAKERYLSRWCVPVTIGRLYSRSEAKIEDCRIELVLAASVGSHDPISLRWRSGDDPRGVDVVTLQEGRIHIVPVAIRCEKVKDVSPEYSSIADGIARLTSLAYLRDGNTDFHKIENPLQFELVIISGDKSWRPRHFYSLNIPFREEDSNGRFILEVIPYE